jgi:hypothetical protein
MLIQFDPGLVEIRKVRIHHVTTSLGGSIKYSEYDDTRPKNKRVVKRPFPMAVARLFIKLYERSNFFNPADGAIMFYDGMAIAAELAPVTVAFGAMTLDEWVPDVETKFNMMLVDMGNHMNTSDEWFFDGTFVYRFDGELSTQIEQGNTLTEDGRFVTIQAWCYHFSHLLHRNAEVSPRVCLGFRAGTEFAVTSPVWAGLGGLNNSNTKDSNDAADNIGLATSLDSADSILSVNLNCILYIAKSMTNIFGYRATYPLGLPQLMVQLQTVNLGAIPKHSKALYPANIPFTHLLAWLIGLHNNIISLEQVIELRKSLKYLTTKGTYDRATENIAKYETMDIPLVTIEQAKELVRDLSFEQIVSWPPPNELRRIDITLQENN